MTTPAQGIALGESRDLVDGWLEDVRIAGEPEGELRPDEGDEDDERL